MNVSAKIAELLRLPAETEWVEFKRDNTDAKTIGEYISALANSAALHGKLTAYIVWGVADGTHTAVGTGFRPKQKKHGNEDLESWLLHQLKPRIDFKIHESDSGGTHMVLFEIQAANSEPVRFNGEEFIRVGSYKKKLKDYPGKERELWRVLSATQDWSAELIEQASLADLDVDALVFARAQYRQKHPQQAAEIDRWDDATFLNKAKLSVRGTMTRAGLLLLGKPETTHFLAPAQARITWILNDAKNQPKDYQHFDPPFLLASDRLFQKIRNLTVRHLPGGTLFPQEVTQYDTWVMRETLHNCIAHQDYTLAGRIIVVESPDTLLFENLGSFIPGSVEEMIRSDAPPEVYRNPFLAQAMDNLNMIETIGSGIKRMFTRQRERSFPMPDYELGNPKKVAVRLTGQVLDENYTRLLLNRTDLDLMDVIALDRVQKKQAINDDAFKRLKALKLVEGRRPGLFVSAKVAAATGEKAAYIKNRAFDKEHYRGMIVAFLKKFGEASRAELEGLLVGKISDVLTEKQKRDFVNNLLQGMKREALLEVDGATRWARWRLRRAGEDVE